MRNWKGPRKKSNMSAGRETSEGILVCCYGGGGSVLQVGELRGNGGLSAKGKPVLGHRKYDAVSQLGRKPTSHQRRQKRRGRILD